MRGRVVGGQLLGNDSGSLRANFGRGRAGHTDDDPGHRDNVVVGTQDTGAQPVQLRGSARTVRLVVVAGPCGGCAFT